MERVVTIGYLVDVVKKDGWICLTDLDDPRVAIFPIAPIKAFSKEGWRDKFKLMQREVNFLRLCNKELHESNSISEMCYRASLV